jgi:hypothetical protein
MGVDVEETLDAEEALDAVEFRMTEDIEDEYM